MRFARLKAVAFGVVDDALVVPSYVSDMAGCG